MYVFYDLQNRIIQLLDLNTAVDGEGNSFGPFVDLNLNEPGTSRKFCHAGNINNNQPKSPSEEALNSFNEMLEAEEHTYGTEESCTEGNSIGCTNNKSD